MNSATTQGSTQTKPTAFLPKDPKTQNSPSPATTTKAPTAKTKTRGNALAADSTPSTKGVKQETKEVQEYLKVIDRLEQGLISKKIKPDELEGSIKRLEDKLLALKPEQKKKLLGLKFFMKNKIEDLKALKSHLTRTLLDQKERAESLELLRDRQFIALLHGLPGTLENTYNQSAKPNQASPVSTTQIKA